MFIDTHSHLYSEQFDNDRNDVVENAINSGISKILLPNIDIQSIQALKTLTKEYPDVCFPMMGLHPCSVVKNYVSNLNIIRNELEIGNYIAIGEIGIDLYWSKEFINEQILAFETQIKWALEFNLPIVIHARDSFKEIYEVLDKYKTSNLKGVFHCFSGKINDVKKIRTYKNFLFGIGGVLTYKNTKLKETLIDVSLDEIILETDSPYLPPVPYRGQRNEPKYILEVAKILSEIYNEKIENIAKITSENAKKCFNLS